MINKVHIYNNKTDLIKNRAISLWVNEIPGGNRAAQMNSPIYLTKLLCVGTLSALLFLFCSLPGRSQSADSWNIFRGDPSLSGYTSARLRFPMELKWTFQSDDALVAAPVVGDDAIYAGSIGGFIYAISWEGKLKWKFETDNSIEAPALYLDGKVYVGDFSGSLYALDAKSGKLVWKYATENQIMGSPNYVFVNGELRILVGSYDYFLHCIDAETGKAVWKYESDNFINGAPAIANNLAIFGGCDGFLHLVDVRNGQASDKIEVATYIASSVAIASELVYTGDYDGFFSCIDISKKEIKWQFENRSSNLPILASPAIRGNKIVIGGQDKFVRCFDNQGEQDWSFNAGGRIDASPVIVRNTVLATTMDGMLYALNLNNGSEIWSYEIGSAIAHNPAVTNGRIIVGARDGNIYLFEE